MGAVAGVERDRQNVLRTAGKLALLYGSFAGVVATLVFLYISATTLIFGAEINGVLRGDVEADVETDREVDIEADSEADQASGSTRLARSPRP